MHILPLLLFVWLFGGCVGSVIVAIVRRWKRESARQYQLALRGATVKQRRGRIMRILLLNGR